MVACVQVFAKTIRLRGAAVRLGGIGSVATHESCRGRGVSSELLVQTIERMRQRGMALSLLFAGQAAPLYERHGWHRIPIALIRLRARGARPPATPGGRSARPTSRACASSTTPTPNGCRARPCATSATGAASSAPPERPRRTSA